MVLRLIMHRHQKIPCRVGLQFSVALTCSWTYTVFTFLLSLSHVSILFECCLGAPPKLTIYIQILSQGLPLGKIQTKSRLIYQGFYMHYSLTFCTNHEICIKSFLEMRMLRFREVEQIPQDHIANTGRIRI